MVSLPHSWKCNGSPSSKTSWTRKWTTTVFWYKEGILMVELLPQAAPVSSVYCSILVFFCGKSCTEASGHGKCWCCMPIAGWIPTIKQCQHWWHLASLSHHIHQTCRCQNSVVNMVIKYEPFRHWVLVELSLRVNQLQREAGHLHQSSAESTNKWNFTSILPYAFMVFTGTTLPLSLTRQTHCRDKTTKK